MTQETAVENPARNSYPLFETVVNLQSAPAIRIMNRYHSRVSYALLNADAILRDAIIRNRVSEEAVNQLEETIEQLLEPVSVDINHAIERNSVVMKENNITLVPEYTNPKSFQVRVRSPQFLSFIQIITNLDTLMVQLDALWFNRIVSNKRRSEEIYQWQRRLAKLSNRIIHFERQVRQSGQNKSGAAQEKTSEQIDSLGKAEKDKENEKMAEPSSEEKEEEQEHLTKVV